MSDVGAVTMSPTSLQSTPDAEMHSGSASPGSSPRPVTETSFSIAFEGVCFETRRSVLKRRESVLTNLCGVISGGVHAVVCTEDFVSRKALEVLAGIEKRCSSGTIMANALPVVSSAFREHVGYIASPDVCMLDATGRDNLLFSIRMRLDTMFEERIIKEAAEVCGLKDRLDTMVEHMTVSERLRLSIAMELVLDPSVIVLEDAMRYLSVSEHFDFAAVLQRIAKGGCRTVILSLNTMPWPIYDTLDGIIMLSPHEGRVLFSGSKLQCERFLQEEVVPEGVEAKGGSLVDLMVQWEEEGEMGHVANTFSHSAVALQLSEVVKRHKERVASDGFGRVVKDVTPCPPSVLAQNVLLMGYSIRRALLRPDFIFSWIGLFVTFFLLAALSANQQHDQNGMQNKRGIIFSLLSCAMHVNIVFIDSEISEYHSFIHMRNNRYFGVLQYFAVTVVRLLIPRVLFSVIGVAFTAFIFSSAVPLSTLLGLTSFAHASFILLLAYWWPVSNDLTLGNLLYYAYCVLCSGFLICLRSFPKLFSSTSMLRHGYGGAVAYELRGNPYSCDATVTQNITLDASYCYTGSQYLELEGFEDDGWGVSALVLLITSIVLLILVAFSMRVSWVSRNFAPM